MAHRTTWDRRTFLRLRIADIHRPAAARLAPECQNQNQLKQDQMEKRINSIWNTMHTDGCKLGAGEPLETKGDTPIGKVVTGASGDKWGTVRGASDSLSKNSNWRKRLSDPSCLPANMTLFFEQNQKSQLHRWRF